MFFYSTSHLRVCNSLGASSPADERGQRVDDQLHDLDDHDEGEPHPEREGAAEGGEQVEHAHEDGLLDDEGLAGGGDVDLELGHVGLHARLDLGELIRVGVVADEAEVDRLHFMPTEKNRQL